MFVELPLKSLTVGRIHNPSWVQRDIAWCTIRIEQKFKNEGNKGRRNEVKEIGQN